MLPFIARPGDDADDAQIVQRIFVVLCVSQYLTAPLLRALSLQPDVDIDTGVGRSLGLS